MFFTDLIGHPAAIVIEGAETHTRTSFLPCNEKTILEHGIKTPRDINLPVAHTKVYGWYDNERGSYVNFKES